MARIEHATIADDILEKGSKFWEEQLKAEVFKQQIRRDAKRMVEDHERDAMNTGFETNAQLVYAPLPTATPELMPGLLPESGTAAIVGETDTGKSLIACEIGSSLLTGMPLWGSIKPNRTIDKIVYILGEHTCVTLQGLFHRTKLPHEGKFMLIGPEHLHPYKALVIGGIQQPLAVDRMLRWTEGANLIVFDPLAGFIQGLTAEQDNSSMRTLIDTMSYIADKQKAACLILSHMGKPKMDDQGGEVRRTSYAMRGASAQEDALTHVFYLRKSTLVKQQGSTEEYQLSVRKFKGNPSSDIFRLRRDPETKRNSLVNVQASRGGPTKEEKEAVRRKVGNLMSERGLELKVAIELVASMDSLPVETVKRWYTEATD